MLLFPNEQFRKLLDYITRNHKLVLSSFIIDELTAVVARKFPKKRDAVDSFLSNLWTSLEHSSIYSKERYSLKIKMLL